MYIGSGTVLIGLPRLVSCPDKKNSRNWVENGATVKASGNRWTQHGPLEPAARAGCCRLPTTLI